MTGIATKTLEQLTKIDPGQGIGKELRSVVLSDGIAPMGVALKKRRRKGEVRVIGFKLDDKIDVIAATALGLSIITLSVDVVGALRGPQITLYRPSYVTFTRFNEGSKDAPRYTVHVDALMAYTNTALIGTSGVVTDEQVSFSGPDGNVVLPAYEFFDSFDVTQGDPDGPLVYQNRVTAAPRLVPAHDSLSHETEFVPEYAACNGTTRCAVTVEGLTDVAGSNRRVELTFSAEVIGRSTRISAICTINSREINMLDVQKRGWTEVECLDDASDKPARKPMAAPRTAASTFPQK